MPEYYVTKGTKKVKRTVIKEIPANFEAVGGSLHSQIKVFLRPAPDRTKDSYYFEIRGDDDKTERKYTCAAFYVNKDVLRMIKLAIEEQI